MQRPLTDFEVTVQMSVPTEEERTSVFMREPVAEIPSQEDEDTQICDEPSAIRAHFLPPSESLIADAEAILSAYRRPAPVHRTWADRMRMAANTGPLQIRRSPLERLATTVLDAADALGGFVVRTGQALYRSLASRRRRRRATFRAPHRR